MASNSTRAKSSQGQRNPTVPSEKDINILLLGQTGVGKTTFINAFANYLRYNTLDEAKDGDMQVPIPDSFSITDEETSELKVIEVGDKTKEPRSFNDTQCRCYLFPIGDRYLRLIDTPGMGDTRGIEQDSKNFFEILTYVSHYEHLRGICIFLKPNEQRLTIMFRLCITEILRYLHEQARENILFIFTNARSTFFMPGSSQKMLQMLLKEHHERLHVEIPFTKENTFFLDNESFRYLAIHKYGMKMDVEQTETYRKSWERTVKECQRLFAYVIQRSPHAVADSASLCDVEQFIRRLARPIPEILRLILQNIQIAQDYKQLLQNKSNMSFGLYQNFFRILPLHHPRLICIDEKCSKIISVMNETKIPSYSVCQKSCYLSGVIQEAISDSRMAQCKGMDKQTNRCKICDCSWESHMNITYEYDVILKSIDDNNNRTPKDLVQNVDRRIRELKEEQAEIERIYERFSQFLHANAIHPDHDNEVHYFRFFIQEERMKRDEGARNEAVIQGLEEITKRYQDNINAFKTRWANDEDFRKTKNVLPSNEEMFSELGKLHRLPINGQLFRDLPLTIKAMAEKAVRRTEKLIEWPDNIPSTEIMNTLERIMSTSF